MRVVHVKQKYADIVYLYTIRIVFAFKSYATVFNAFPETIVLRMLACVCERESGRVGRYFD